MQATNKSQISGTTISDIIEFPTEILEKKSPPQKSCKAKRKTTSHYLGVSWDKQTNKWLAKAKVDPITGKTPKKRFLDEEEASKWVIQKNIELSERIRVTRDLGHPERLESIECILKLESVGMYGRGFLTKAVEEYIRRNPEASPTSTSQLFEEWLQYKRVIKKCKNHTILTAKGVIQGFIDQYQKTPVTAITREMCRDFIYQESSNKSSFHRFRYLGELFNFAQKEGRISPDPDAHSLWNLDKPNARKLDEDDEYKVPWSLEEFETLLKFSLENEDQYQCTAFLLLGSYAGIRTSEMLKLQFGEIRNRKTHGIDIDRGIVSIPSSIAKTKAKRNFKMHTDLQAALKSLRDRPRPTKKKHCKDLKRPTDLGSKVVTNTEARLKGFRRVLHLSRIEGGAGLPIFNQGGQKKKDKKGNIHITKPSAWIQNGLRTSFASYHYEAHNDKKLTSSIMGHTEGMHVFDQHYRMLVEVGDGVEFFEIARKVFSEFGYKFPPVSE